MSKSGLLKFEKPKKISKPKIALREVFCIFCGEPFLSKKQFPKCCSKSCGGKCGGLKSVQTQHRRSKNESLFFDLISAKLKAEPNKRVVGEYDCDVFLPNFNVAVMWNGNWHFKKCAAKHSVAAVQNRDEYKIRKMVDVGITPYIISDFGKHNPAFIQSEYKIFLEWMQKRFPFFS